MGIRCLLGHDFSEPELQRRREERGDEVIVAVSEVKTCRRCGATQIVSENKEITSIEQLAATAADSPGGQPRQQATSAPTTDSLSTDAQSSRADSAGTTPAEPATEPARSTSQTDPSDSPAEEDAEILSDETTPTTSDANRATGSDADRTAGTGADRTAGTDADRATESDADAPDAAQPVDDAADAAERSDDAGDEPTPWPEQNDADTDDASSLIEQAESGTTDETTERGPPEDDAEILPNEADSEADRQPGAWPEYEDREEPDTASEPTPWPEQTGEDTGYNASNPADSAESGLGGGGGFVPDIADAEATLDDDTPSADVDVADAERTATHTERTATDAEAGDASRAEQPAAESPAEAGAADSNPGESAATESSSGSPEDDAEFLDAEADAPSEDGFTHADASGADFEPIVDSVPTEFFCPECGLARRSGVSSMRAGDICPSCKRGYIAERPVDR